MADQKISGLPTDSSLDATHYVPLVDPTGPTTKRTFLSVLAAWLFDQLNLPSGATGSPITRGAENLANYIVSGLLWTGDSYGVNRNASMTTGVVYINGRRISISAVAARAFTASKDTYVDVLDNGNGTGTLVYTEVANNAASPALAANSIRLAIIVTGATTIAAATSIFQDNSGFTGGFPTTTNVGNGGIDSLGNKVYNTDPNPKAEMVFVKTNNALDSKASAAYVDLNGNTLTIPLLAAAIITIETQVQARWQGAPSVSSFCNIMVDGVQMTEVRVDIGANGTVWSIGLAAKVRKAAGSVVIKNQVKSSTGTLDTMGGKLLIRVKPI